MPLFKFTDKEALRCQWQ